MSASVHEIWVKDEVVTVIYALAKSTGLPDYFPFVVGLLKLISVSPMGYNLVLTQWSPQANTFHHCLRVLDRES